MTPASYRTMSTEELLQHADFSFAGGEAVKAKLSSMIEPENYACPECVTHEQEVDDLNREIVDLEDKLGELTD